MRQRANCRSCNGEVIWIKTPRGKNMPVDAEPDPEGNIRLTYEGEQAHGEWLSKGEVQHTVGEELYVSHFSTCPDADEHRR